MGGELLRLSVVLPLTVLAILPWLYLRWVPTPWSVAVPAALMTATVVALVWAARQLPEQPPARWLRVVTLLVAAGTAGVHALWLMLSVVRAATAA